MDDRKQYFFNLIAGLGFFVVAWFVFFNHGPTPANQLALTLDRGTAGVLEINFLSPLTRIFKPTELSVGTPSNIATFANLADYFITPDIKLIKNEAESLQVVLNSNQPHLASLDYQVLLNGQPVNDLTLELYQVDFAPVTSQIYSRPGDLSPVGLYSDPLLPYSAGATISSNEPIIWWLTARATATARIGVYSIVLNLTIDGGPFSKTFEVQVLNYNLPKQSAFKLVLDTDFDEGTAGYTPFDYHYARTVSEKQQVVQNYMDYFSKNRINNGIPYYDAGCVSCGYLKSDALFLPVTAWTSDSITVDYTSFDQKMQRYFDTGRMSAFMIDGDSWGHSSFRLPQVSGDRRYCQAGTEALTPCQDVGTDFVNYPNIQKLYWTSVANHLAQKGWLDQSLIYIDEPFVPDRNGAFIPRDNNFTNILREANTNSKIVVLLDKYAANFKDMIGSLQNIDYYAPVDYSPGYLWEGPGDAPESKNPLSVLRPTIDMVKDSTDKIGTYWTENGHMHVDRPAIDLRIWGWKYWKNNIEFLYHWNVLMFAYDIARGKVNPWQSVSYKWGAGGSTLFYPPCKTGQCSTFNPTIVPSIRSELYREALEDYDSLDILNRLIAEASAKRLNTANARLALETATGLVTDLSNWTRDMKKFEATKQSITLAIDSLSASIARGSDLTPITPPTPMVPIPIPKTPQPIIIDLTPPPAITDLQVATTESKAATLTWTAPYQDLTSATSGPAASYDLRYARDPITEENWTTAAQATGEPDPATSGQKQTYALVNLGAGQSYHAVIKSRDEAGNVSALSNLVSFSTAAEPPPAGSSGGGRSVVADRTPPAPPVLLTSYGFDHQAILNWRNPADADFVRTLVLRSAGPLPVITRPGNPHYLSQATIVYDGTAVTFMDINLTNGQSYYYTLYAYDRAGNYSTPVSTTVRAAGGRRDLILQLMRRLLELLQQLLALTLRR